MTDYNNLQINLDKIYMRNQKISIITKDGSVENLGQFYYNGYTLASKEWVINYIQGNTIDWPTTINSIKIFVNNNLYTPDTYNTIYILINGTNIPISNTSNITLYDYITNLNGQNIKINQNDSTSIYSFITDNYFDKNYIQQNYFDKSYITTNYCTSEQVQEQIKNTPLSLSNIKNGTIKLQGDVIGNGTFNGENNVIIDTSLNGTVQLSINGQKIPMLSTDSQSIFDYVYEHFLTSGQVEEQIKQTSISLSNINNGTIELYGDIVGVGYLGQGNKVNIETTINNNDNFLPVGSLLPWIGKEGISPSTDHYILCNGAPLDINTYSDLYDVIGGTFGYNQENNTFNLPDLRDKFIQGTADEKPTYLAAGLPKFNGGITHNLTTASAGSHAHPYSYFNLPATLGTGIPQGPWKYEWITKTTDYAGSHTHTINGNINFNFDGDEIYGKSSTVQPPALKVKIFIKYK